MSAASHRHGPKSAAAGPSIKDSRSKVIMVSLRWCAQSWEVYAGTSALQRKPTSDGAWHCIADVQLEVHDVGWLALQLLGQGLEQRRVVRRLWKRLLQCQLPFSSIFRTCCSAAMVCHPIASLSIAHPNQAPYWVALAMHIETGMGSQDLQAVCGISARMSARTPCCCHRSDCQRRSGCLRPAYRCQIPRKACPLLRQQRPSGARCPCWQQQRPCWRPA